YDALRSLNKGVEQRAARQAKAAREPGLAAQEAPGAKRERDDAFAAASHDEMDVDLSPMTGDLVDAAHLVLSRTAVRDGQLVRQGLLLDVPALGRWLREQALGDGLGAHATVAFATPLAPAVDPEGAFVYRHRFAEPFDGLSAALALAALPSVGNGPTFVYALSALVLGAGILGLAALYRMVAVAVGFAERRSNFVAAVTHELKTPLTAIRMYGEMLRDGMVASEAKRDEYHRHITAEAERLGRLINNVLEFARLEKGTRDVVLATGAVGPVVEEAAGLLRPHVEREGFALEVAIEAGLPPVRFERDALLQVVFNLVDNAVKYGDGAGAPRAVSIACRRDGAGVRLTVRDRGPGVPPAHVERIFEPFYRGESELTRRRKGTGLGLALVRGLADCMGARVTGRNAEGGGFEVAVVLAAAPAVAPNVA
ncbi:MAG TPA: HAMP domain-containing sensor histidine kinase, partial [Candidatus Binatia bacterium]|nr:HAMP domain-containing sensor histidine kinase [Candidatus Binatia bacterium]